ncbi:MAG: hypothetical protein LBV79_09320 [Candidatus Adiutrix sp.]|jgi:processive 1,2-diacylglycerol beta-glucosyltransferase|nr:hypothetical protein [Candidatus Adiutrix sp.]
MKRLLTVHGSAGNGHRSAARAINQALAERGSEAILADVLSFAGPRFRSFYGRGYELAAQHVRWLCRLVYVSTDRPAAQSRLVEHIEKSHAAKVSGMSILLAENEIDAVCCTHFLPMRLVADLRRRGAYKGGLQVCVTDYQVHGFWFDLDVDRYHVATAEAAERLAAWGVPAERIGVTGIPVRREFAAAGETAVGPEPWRILMLGSSLKVREVLGFLDDLGALNRPLTVTLVAGRNQALIRALEAYNPPPSLYLDRRGLEPRLELFMAESDLLVTKPGGIICSEALNMGLPMLFVSPIPNHEVYNAQTLTSAGAGMMCFGQNSLKTAVRSLMEQPVRLTTMRRAALKLARPRAADDIATALLSA